MSTEEEQMFLFNDNTKTEKSDRLAKSIDKLESKFGKNIIQTGFTNKKSIED